MAYQLIDTSVWVQWFRDTGSIACQAVAQLRAEPGVIALTQPIELELRAGSTDAGLIALDRLLTGVMMLDVDPVLDFHHAAELYRAVRRSGHTVRSMMDCVIAAVALRTGATLVHCDVDFDRIAAVAADLRVTSFVRR